MSHALIAFFYGMVGHGGASGYLALGALMGQPLGPLKSQALLLNLGVSGMAALLFWRGGWLRWRLLLPLAVSAVPMAYLGAKLSLPLPWAQALLALALVAAALRLLSQAWFKEHLEQQAARTPSLFVLLGLGLSLGFLAGLTGVGGGIYLSPLLLFFRWADMKETAACSAAFIWLNSLAGLLAQPHAVVPLPLELLVLTLVGGGLGAWLGAGFTPRRRLAQVLAGVIFVAALKLGALALS